jgi:hypothetical protein
MEEQHTRFFAAHVMVNGHDVHTAFAQRFQDGLEFFFEDSLWFGSCSLLIRISLAFVHMALACCSDLARFGSDVARFCSHRLRTTILCSAVVYIFFLLLRGVELTMLIESELSIRKHNCRFNFQRPIGREYTTSVVVSLWGSQDPFSRKPAFAQFT